MQVDLLIITTPTENTKSLRRLCSYEISEFIRDIMKLKLTIHFGYDFRTFFHV